MIDPNNIVRKYLNDELEELFTFSVCVAGKTASTIAKRVNKLSYDSYVLNKTSVFNFIRNHKNFADYLKLIGIGCYEQKSKTLKEAVDKFTNGAIIRKATVNELETVWGVGPKTSRFFVMCHKPGVQYAALDTHLLKFLNANGVVAPKTTPKGKKYLELEQKFLKMVPKPFTPAEFDLIIWKKYAKKIL